MLNYFFRKHYCLNVRTSTSHLFTTVSQMRLILPAVTPWSAIKAILRIFIRSFDIFTKYLYETQQGFILSERGLEVLSSVVLLGLGDMYPEHILTAYY